ncbi:MAG: hypothetical protein H7Y36_03750 [Armatimonadetes bacterium]|nr:hypothetical protein [Akkermansiaceae bacterium]
MPTTTTTEQWLSPVFQQSWEDFYHFRGKQHDPLKLKIETDFRMRDELKKQFGFEIAIHNNDPKTLPVWVKFFPGNSDSLSPDGTDIFCTIQNEALISRIVQPPSGLLEYASTDWSDGNSSSSFGDADAFDSGMSSRIDAVALVNARSVGNENNSAMPDSNGLLMKPLSAKATKDYLIAGGAEFVEARIGERAEKRLCGKCAKWLFVSSHGLSCKYHDPDGPIETIDGAPEGGRILVAPEEVEWSDMECVILNLCSVLDICDLTGKYQARNPNGTYPDAQSKSPGKRWAATGPKMLLGYNFSAPRDEPEGTAIANDWITAVKSGAADGVDAWREANAKRKAWNACAIDIDKVVDSETSYYCFETIKLFNKTVYVEWYRFPKSSW